MKEFATMFSKMGPMYLFLVTVVFMVVMWAILYKNKNTKPYTGQLLVLFGIAWVAILFTIVTFSFHEGKGALATATKASSIPRLWSGLMIPVFILVIVPVLKGKEKADAPFENLKLVISVFAVVLASILLFRYIGYYVSSGLMILVIMILLQQKNKVVLAAVPLCWIAFTYLVFARLLFIPLPAGMIFEKLLG